MGLFSKFKNGGKTFYKVYTKCSTTEHSNIFLIASKDPDFETKAKNKDKELLQKIFGDFFVINAQFVLIN